MVFYNVHGFHNRLSQDSSKVVVCLIFNKVTKFISFDCIGIKSENYIKTKFMSNNKSENYEDFFPKTVNQQNLFEYFGPISKGRLQQRKNKKQ